jgi:hypothetical protein
MILSPSTRFAANQPPDHDTMATFGQRFSPALQGLSVPRLSIASEMGVLMERKSKLMPPNSRL